MSDLDKDEKVKEAKEIISKELQKYLSDRFIGSPMTENTLYVIKQQTIKILNNMKDINRINEPIPNIKVTVNNNNNEVVIDFFDPLTGTPTSPFLWLVKNKLEVL